MPRPLRHHRRERTEAGLRVRLRYYVHVSGRPSHDAAGVTTLQVDERPADGAPAEAETPRARRRPWALPFAAVDVATVAALAAVAALVVGDWLTATLVALALVAAVLLLETALAVVAPGTANRLLGARVVPDAALVSAALVLGTGGAVAAGVYLVS